jgi:hydroxyethylthiazole kinase-like uncharacterized protein yjeF
MKKVFDEVKSLDKRAINSYFLSEELLMEHASLGIQNYISKKFKKNKKILIVCGSGNNGADGIALARLLHKKFEVSLCLFKSPKTSIGILQEKRAKAVGVNFVKEIFEADIIVDCLFGTGLDKKLDDKTIDLISQLNSFNSFKIACDIPSGINSFGQVLDIAFKADITITMGAIKTGTLSDVAKDYVGKIKVVNLGINEYLFQGETNKFLLEKTDLILPFRDKKNSHKGTYGHLNVVSGDKIGASIIASKAAFSFGAGLVTVIIQNQETLPHTIMQAKEVSKNCTALAIGMGLGDIDKNRLKDLLSLDIPKVLDADIFYKIEILEYLDENIVLTPHPKEFISLLKLSKIADITIEELQTNRFLYVEKFSSKYPKVVLLLKGANVIITQNKKIYINNFGTSSLSKGGSGDVLSGLIASLLAQGYKPLEATINASLAHTIAARNYSKNNYSLTPDDLIKEIKKL